MLLNFYFNVGLRLGRMSVALVLLCSIGKSAIWRGFSESVKCYCVLNTW